MERLILLARHGTHCEVGRVLSGRSEIALDAAGEAEAAALGAWAAREGVRAIVASPRRRTRQTAAAAAEATGLPVQAAPALDEIDFGTFAGRAFAALEGDADWRRWNAERDIARCPGGETMAEVVARARACLDGLAGGPTLCVTHCDVIRGLVCDALGLDYRRMFALGCDPGSVTRLALGDGGVRLLSLNERP